MLTDWTLARSAINTEARDFVAKLLDLPSSSVEQLLCLDADSLRLLGEHAVVDLLPNDLQMGTVAVDRLSCDEVSFLRSWDAKGLKIIEPEEDIRRHPSYGEYVRLSKSGSKPPYIRVNQSWDRTADLSLNRRRVLVAQELGQPIEGWYSPVNPYTGLSLKLQDVKGLYRAISLSINLDQADAKQRAERYLQNEATFSAPLVISDDADAWLIATALWDERQGLSQDEMNGVIEAVMLDFPGFPVDRVQSGDAQSDLPSLPLLPLSPGFRAAWSIDHEMLAVFSEAHSTAEDLAATLRQCLVAHTGLSAVDGDDRVELLQAVIRGYGQNELMTGVWNEVLDQSSEESILKQAEDVLSRCSVAVRERTLLQAVAAGQADKEVFGRNDSDDNERQLDQALLREAKGDSPTATLSATGWNRGPDDQWRFIISDREAKLSPAIDNAKERGSLYSGWVEAALDGDRGVALADILDHPSLYAAYPRLKSLRVYIDDRIAPGKGAVLAGFGGIRVANPRLGEYDLLTTLLRQVQYGIERIGGFPLGRHANANGSLEETRSARELLDQACALRDWENGTGEAAREWAKQPPPGWLGNQWLEGSLELAENEDELNASLQENMRRMDPIRAYRQHAGIDQHILPPAIKAPLVRLNGRDVNHCPANAVVSGQKPRFCHTEDSIQPAIDAAFPEVDGFCEALLHTGRFVLVSSDQVPGIASFKPSYSVERMAGVPAWGIHQVGEQRVYPSRRTKSASDWDGRISVAGVRDDWEIVMRRYFPAETVNKLERLRYTQFTREEFAQHLDTEWLPEIRRLVGLSSDQHGHISLYDADQPEELADDLYLDWRKPWREQPLAVQQALVDIDIEALARLRANEILDEAQHSFVLNDDGRVIAVDDQGRLVSTASGNVRSWSNEVEARKMLLEELHSAVLRGDHGEFTTGEYVYRGFCERFSTDPELREAIGDPSHEVSCVEEAASRYLHDLGLAGIRHEAGEVGGAEPVYVVFSHDSVDISQVRMSRGRRLTGYVLNGITHLVVDNIEKGANLRGLLLHEIGVHALTMGRSDAEFRDILRQVEWLRDEGNARVLAAYRRVPQSTPADRVTEEALAYLVQYSPSMDTSQRFLAWLRNCCRRILDVVPGLSQTRLGDWVSRLSVGDLVYMATRATLRAPTALRDQDEVDTRDGSALAASRRDEQWYRSRLADTTPGLAAVADKQGQVYPEQAIKWLSSQQRKGRFRQEELEWSGLKEWLSLHTEKVSVRDIQAFVEGHGLVVRDVWRDEGAHTLGASFDVEQVFDENLSLVYEIRQDGEPAGRHGTASQAWNAIAQLKKEADEERPLVAHYADYALPGGEGYRELVMELAVSSGEQLHVNTHWPESNVLAHVRMKDYTGQNGERTLVVMEIQSDWAQEGRKFGFSDGAPTEAELLRLQSNILERFRLGEIDRDERNEAFSQLSDLRQGIGVTRRGPFVTDTGQWVGLAIKRVAAYAAMNGYDQVAVINGDQANSIASLTDRIDSLEYEESAGRFTVAASNEGKPVWYQANMTAEALEALVGKEVAQRIVAGEASRVHDNGTSKVLSGLALQGDGSGMKVFYDSIVPQVMRATLRSLGGQTGIVTIPSTDDEVWALQGFVVDEALRRTVDQGVPLMSVMTTAPTFFSPLLQAAWQLPQEKGTGHQMLSTLRRFPGVKQDELEWTGLTEHLDTTETITREQIIDFIEENQVVITESLRVSAEREVDTPVVVFGPWQMEAHDEELIREAALNRMGDEVERRVANGEPVSGKAALLDDLMREERDARTNLLGSFRSITVNLPGGPYLYEQYVAPNGSVSLYQDGKQVGNFAANSLDDAKVSAQVRDLAYARAGISETPAPYAEYALPGGDDYRELLLRWRSPAPAPVAEQTWETMRANNESGDFAPWSELADTEKKAVARWCEANREFVSIHWPGSSEGVVALIRTTTRHSLHGKRVLLVEEVQSDWASQGRQQGFADDLMQAVQGGRVHRGPFVTQSDAWVTLALKRIMALAVHEGFDQVAFVNEETVTDRFGMDADDGANRRVALLYDTIVPNRLQELLRKTGGTGLDAVPISVAGADHTGTEHHLFTGFSVTAAMRQQVLEDGLPLFSYSDGEETPLTDLMPTGGRAQKGGERGVNGYWYKGGQFLPSTQADPGRWRIDKKWVTSSRELIAPGERAYQPTPFSRSILAIAGFGAITTLDDEGRLIIRENVRHNDGSPVTANDLIRPGVRGVLGKEELTLGELVEAWNAGQRWFDVQPDAEVVTTKGAAPSSKVESAEALYGDMRGLAFAIVSPDQSVLTSGTVPQMLDSTSEQATVDYYVKLAERMGGALWLGKHADQPKEDPGSSPELLIFGMTWDELVARQQKVAPARAIQSVMPDDAILVYDPTLADPKSIIMQQTGAAAQNAGFDQIDDMQQLRSLFDKASEDADLDALLAITDRSRVVFRQQLENVWEQGAVPVIRGSSLVYAVHPSTKTPGRIQITSYNDTGALGDTTVDDLAGVSRELNGLFCEVLSVTEGEETLQRLADAEMQYQAKKKQSLDTAAGGADNTVRFDVGRSLTPEQRSEVMATLTDVYLQKGHQKECRVNSRGEEYYAFPHAPDLFEQSDITGAKLRYYVTLLDGRIAHPSELFPDISQDRVVALMEARQAELDRAVLNMSSMLTEDMQFESLAEAEAYWDRLSDESRSKSFHGKPTILDSFSRVPFVKNGRIVLLPYTALDRSENLDALETMGWQRWKSRLRSMREVLESIEAADLSQTEQMLELQARVRLEAAQIMAGDIAAERLLDQASAMLGMEGLTTSPVPETPSAELPQVEAAKALLKKVQDVDPSDMAAVAELKQSVRELAATVSEADETGALVALDIAAARLNMNGVKYAQQRASEVSAQSVRREAELAGVRTNDPVAQAKALLAEQRELDATNRIAVANFKRKVRRIAKKVPVSNEAAVLAIDLAATRMGMENLSFADAESATSASASEDAIAALPSQSAQLDMFGGDGRDEPSFSITSPEGAALVNGHTPDTLRVSMEAAYPGVASALEGAGRLQVITSDQIPQSVRRVTGYHGSPHRFNRFSTEAIGTGEGRQAFGWGLYFAGRQEVARFYRDILSAGQSLGVPRSRMISETPSKRERTAVSAVEDAFNLTLNVYTEGAVPKVSWGGNFIDFYNFRNELAELDAQFYEANRDRIEGDIAAHAANIRRAHPDATEREVEHLLERAGLLHLRAPYSHAYYSAAASLPSEGYLYQVSLPEEDRYLVWDSPVTAQSDVARTALEALYLGENGPLATSFSVNFDVLTAREVYQELSAVLGDAQSASAYLLDQGILGLKYLDGTSRGSETRWSESADPSKYHRLAKGVAENYLQSAANDTKQAIIKLRRDAEASGAQQFADAADALECNDLTYSVDYNYVIFDDSLVEIEDMLFSQQGRVQAYVQSGVVTMVADNIAQDADIQGILLHEVGVHLMRGSRTEQQWAALLNQFAAMADDPGSRAEAAMKRVPANTPLHLRTEEGLGYFCEMNPHLRLTQQVLSWVREKVRSWSGKIDWLADSRIGHWAERLTENDLVFMAQSGVRAAKLASEHAARIPSREAVVFSQAASDDQDEAETLKELFRGSKVVDDAGMPIKLYHGTDHDFGEFRPSERGLFGSGIYLTTQMEDAEQYTSLGTVRETYAYAHNPFYTRAGYEAGEEIDFESPAVPFIRELFGEEAEEVLRASIEGDGYFGEEVVNELERLGHDAIVADWGNGLSHVIPLYSTQVIDANTAIVHPDEENNEDLSETAAFADWFRGSKVVDKGQPLVVYRGEHGEGEGEPRTLLGSFTFTDDPAVASVYAEQPNDRAFADAASPRVIPAYLALINPIVDNREDPFVDFVELIGKIGHDRAVYFARKHAERIENTNNWEEHFAEDYLSVGELLDAKPDALNSLYMDVYPLLDDAEFVDVAREAGFDGAIHRGNGESAGSIEYRVFGAEQIRSATGTAGAFVSMLPDIHFSLADPDPKDDLSEVAPEVTPADDQVETGEFQRWFAESQVIEADGRPKIVYHGTGSVFSVFSDEFYGASTGQGDWGEGFYFTSLAEVAKSFAEDAYGDTPTVMPVYLSLQNPATKEVLMSDEVQNALQDDMGFVSARDVLMGMGYDGIIWDHQNEGGVEYVAFRPDQIKSATGNVGSFDPDNEDIRYSLEEESPRKRLYQGSPHRFKRFTTDAIGTGEGAQSFGWGLYFASEREVAEYYRTIINPRLVEISQAMISADPVGWAAWSLFSDSDDRKSLAKDAILEAPEMFGLELSGEQLLAQAEALLEEINGEGQLYEVTVPDQDVYLLWDASLNDQPPIVQEAWLAVMADYQRSTGVSDRYMYERWGGARGAELYGLLASRRGPEGASLELLARGVRGVRYLDGISRSKGEGTHNYVIFDERDIEMVTEPAAASTAPDDGPSRHTLDSLREAVDEAFPGLGEALEEQGRLRIITADEMPLHIADGRYSVQGYHSSPHRFSRFDYSAIGSGEGAQAYGYGLYFAGNKAVAEWYRRTFQVNLDKGFDRPTFTVRRDHVEPDRWVIDRYLVTPYGIEESFGTTLYEDREAAIKTLSGQLDGYDEYELSGGGLEFVPRAALYQVRLPSEDNYLQWDERMHAHPMSIQKALKPLLLNEVEARNRAREQLNSLNPARLSHPVIGPLARKEITFEQLTGKDVYEALSVSLGSEAKASERLLSLDVPGIRYLDEASRLFQRPRVVEEGGGYVVYWGNDPAPVQTCDSHAEAEAVARELDTRTYNYVIFNDEVVEIEDVLHSIDGRVQGYVQKGVVTLVADNVDRTASVKGLLLHEVGIHLMQAARSDKQWTELLAQFQAMAEVPGSRAEAAMARVPKKTPQHLRTEEGIGYFCEMNPDLPFTRQVIGWLRDRLRSWAETSDWLADTAAGRWANALTEDDLVYMALAGVRKARAGIAESGMYEWGAVQYSYSDEEYPTSVFWKEWKKHVALRNRPGRSQAALAQWLAKNYSQTNSKHQRVGEFVGGRIGTGEEAFRFRDSIAGFDGYHTYGRAIVSERGVPGYVFFVIPDELIERPLPQYSVKELGDLALLTMTATQHNPGEYELGVLAPIKGGAALAAAMERGVVEDTGRVSREGEPYYRLKIGPSLTKSFMTEAVRRLTISSGAVPNSILYTGRDTGARSGSTNIREFDRRLITTRFSFAGENAETTDQFMLGRARELLARGVEPDRVRRDTGWFMGSDQKWRFEIADDEARLIDPAFTKSWDDYFSDQERERFGRRGPNISGMSNKEMRGYIAWRTSLLNEYRRREEWRPLSEVLHHPKLFAAYPDLAERPVAFPPVMDSLGAYNEKADHIRVMVRTEPEMLSTLLHEVQHAIQAREGFARGGDTGEEFTETVRTEVAQLSSDTQDEVVRWRNENRHLVLAAEAADDRLREALIYDSARRLGEHAEREQPSRVLRLIRNELQWLYMPGFNSIEEARELQREWHNMPPRHRLADRNAFLKDFAERASRLLMNTIPEDHLQQIRDDQRTPRSMLAAYRREADRRNEALAPMRQLEHQSKATKRLHSAIRHMVPYGIYRALYGEVEARNVQARQALTPEERRLRSPLLTQDVSPEEVIIMFGGMDVHAPSTLMSADPAVTRLTHTPDSLRRAMNAAMPGVASSLEKAGLLRVITALEIPSHIADARFSVTGYHGTRHRFERFSSDAIGRGEGAQVFGYGLYFAGERDVAEFYRKQLANNALLDGKPVKDLFDQDQSIAHTLADRMRFEGVTADEARSLEIKDWRDRVELLTAALADETGSDGWGDLDDDFERYALYELSLYQREIAALEAFDTARVKLNPGFTYRATLPPDDQYLLWDKPFREQPAPVRKALTQAQGLNSAVIDNWMDEFSESQQQNGEQLYRALASNMGSDQAASEFLQASGISGIKYLDQWSRVEGEGSFNYVVFDDSQISVEEVLHSRDGRIQGYVHRGVVSMVSDNIALDTSVQGLLLHEVGIHLMKGSRTDDQWRVLLEQFEGMAAVPGSRAEAAMLRVPGNTPPHLCSEEGLGYFCEMNPELPLARKVTAWVREKVRAWVTEGQEGTMLGRLSRWANTLTGDDLIFMAQSGVRAAVALANRPNQSASLSDSADRLPYVDSSRHSSATPSDPGAINYFDDREARVTVRRIKEGCQQAIEKAASIMAERVEPGDILVPLPGPVAMGDASRLLAKAIADKAGGEFRDVLKRTESYVMAEPMLADRSPMTSTVRIEVETELPTDARVHLVDTIIGAGEVMRAAQKVVPTGNPLVFAEDRSSVAAHDINASSLHGASSLGQEVVASDVSARIAYLEARGVNVERAVAPMLRKSFGPSHLIPFVDVGSEEAIFGAGEYRLRSTKVFDAVSDPTLLQKAIDLFNSHGGWRDTFHGDVALAREHSGRRTWAFDPAIDCDGDLFGSAGAAVVEALTREGYDTFVFRGSDGITPIMGVVGVEQVFRIDSNCVATLDIATSGTPSCDQITAAVFGEECAQLYADEVVVSMADYIARGQSPALRPQNEAGLLPIEIASDAWEGLREQIRSLPDRVTAEHVCSLIDRLPDEVSAYVGDTALGQWLSANEQGTIARYELERLLCGSMVPGSERTSKLPGVTM